MGRFVKSKDNANLLQKKGNIDSSDEYNGEILVTSHALYCRTYCFIDREDAKRLIYPQPTLLSIGC
jgi:hypothetical protein